MNKIREDIINHLKFSKDLGLAIRIKVKGHEEQITMVESFLNNHVFVKEFSLHGNELPYATFLLEDIEKALCLKIRYNSAVYIQLRILKASIRGMRMLRKKI